MNTKLKLVNVNTKYVSTVINGVEYKITETLEKELIKKSNDFKSMLKTNKQIPRNYAYFIWSGIYQDSEIQYYSDAVNLRVSDSKWKLIFNKWRFIWKQKLLYLLRLS